MIFVDALWVINVFAMSDRTSIPAVMKQLKLHQFALNLEQISATEQH